MAAMLDISDAVALGMHAMAYLSWQERPQRTGPPGRKRRAGRSKTRAPRATPVAAKEIAQVFKVSQAHLIKVMQTLARKGLLTTARGRRGGFALGKPSSQVMLLDIYEAIHGPLRPSDCLLPRRICGEGECILGRLMDAVNAQVAEYLSRTRLSDLAPVKR